MSEIQDTCPKGGPR